NFDSFLNPIVIQGLSFQWITYESRQNVQWSPVVQILDNYNLGVVQPVVYEHPGLIRTAGGKPYLSRNYSIKPEINPNGAATISVRFLFTTAQFDALRAADARITNPGDLAIVKQPNVVGILIPQVYTPAASDEFITPMTWQQINGGYYIEFQVTSFSNFFITGPQVVLPVRWVNAEAQWISATAARVSWQVADQQQVKDYTVQHSTDGIRFSDVCTVAASNSTTYSCEVNPGVEERHYYRVLQTDVDGKSSYSKTVTLKANPQENMFTILPNPSSGPTTLRYNGAAVRIGSLILYNVNGVEVWRQTRPQVTGNTVTIPLERLGSGLYMLHVNSNKGTEIYKIIKQ
ncbi:MAG: T9SS type A sorting domain-containing protein, partial [Chitinophagaceae bacterium]|nr:T9SS type A sorting domain-containing protein [Chitinophagaceae bacterium]